MIFGIMLGRTVGRIPSVWLSTLGVTLGSTDLASSDFSFVNGTLEAAAASRISCSSVLSSALPVTVNALRRWNLLTASHRDRAEDAVLLLFGEAEKLLQAANGGAAVH